MGLGRRIDLLLSVDGPTGRREHHFPHAMPNRLLQHVQHPKNIYLGVEYRIFYRFSDIHLCGKVHDNVGAFVAEYPFKPPTLNIQLAETSGTIQISPFSCGQIVHNNDLVSFLNKAINHM
jgi:hypothetical protein